jgi:hypothetical protein
MAQWCGHIRGTCRPWSCESKGHAWSEGRCNCTQLCLDQLGSFIHCIVPHPCLCHPSLVHWRRPGEVHMVRRYAAWPILWPPSNVHVRPFQIIQAQLDSSAQDPTSWQNIRSTSERRTQQFLTLATIKLRWTHGWKTLMSWWSWCHTWNRPCRMLMPT